MNVICSKGFVLTFFKINILYICWKIKAGYQSVLNDDSLSLHLVCSCLITSTTCSWSTSHSMFWWRSSTASRWPGRDAAAPFTSNSAQSLWAEPAACVGTSTQTSRTTWRRVLVWSVGSTFQHVVRTCFNSLSKSLNQVITGNIILPWGVKAAQLVLMPPASTCVFIVQIIIS